MAEALLLAGRKALPLEAADAVLAAISLEQVGWWCPVHGSALCPEHYMLFSDGGVAPGYRGVWSEEMRCGQRQPTYRLRGDE